MTINFCIKNLSNLWHGHPPATLQILNHVEKQTGLLFPFDFKEFMQWSNGGEAKLSKIYLSLWEVEKVVSLNHDYQIQHYLGENVLGIGSDGGPICFLLDYRNKLDASFSSINFGDLDPKEIKNIAPTFTDGLTMAISGVLSDDQL
jgi:SMI1 / KNR4 family (SUKH-1)